MARRFRARRLRKLTQQFGVDLPAPNRTEALARRQLARDYSQGRPALSSGIEGGRTSSRVALGDGMRAVRLVIAVLIVSPILMLALSESRFSRQPFAQVTAAPGPVPLTAPVAPGQPQAFSTIGALPALAPAPGTSPAAVASRGADAARISMHLFGAGKPGPNGRASSRRPAMFLRASLRAGSAPATCRTRMRRRRTCRRRDRR